MLSQKTISLMYTGCRRHILDSECIKIKLDYYIRNNLDTLSITLIRIVSNTKKVNLIKCFSYIDIKVLSLILKEFLPQRSYNNNHVDKIYDIQ